MERLLEQILAGILLIAEALGGGSRETEGNVNEVPVPSDRPIKVLSRNKRRTKWQGQNIDAAVIARYGYSAGQLLSSGAARGHRIYNNGGAYTDDAMRCHTGEVWMIAEGAGNPIVVVSEEYKVR